MPPLEQQAPLRPEPAAHAPPAEAEAAAARAAEAGVKPLLLDGHEMCGTWARAGECAANGVHARHVRRRLREGRRCARGGARRRRRHRAAVGRAAAADRVAAEGRVAAAAIRAEASWPTARGSSHRCTPDDAKVEAEAEAEAEAEEEEEEGEDEGEGGRWAMGGGDATAAVDRLVRRAAANGVVPVAGDSAAAARAAAVARVAALDASDLVVEDVDEETVPDLAEVPDLAAAPEAAAATTTAAASADASALS